MIVGELYNAGDSIESLSKRYQVQPGTILNHLARYAKAGHPLKNGKDLQAQTSLSPALQNMAPIFCAPFSMRWAKEFLTMI